MQAARENGPVDGRCGGREGGRSVGNERGARVKASWEACQRACAEKQSRQGAAEAECREARRGQGRATSGHADQTFAHASTVDGRRSMGHGLPSMR